MKAFYLADTDLTFVAQMADVPRVRVVRYLADGTPVYGYDNPVTRQVVELGVLGSFDLMSSSWSAFIPNNAFITNTSTSPFGVRNVDGLFNNLTNPATQIWGAVGSFARSSNSDYSRYLRQSSLNPIAVSTAGSGLKSDPAQQAQVNTLAGLSSGQQPGDTPNGLVKLWGGAGGMTNAEKALVQDSTYGLRINAGSNKIDLTQRYANPYLTVRDYTPRLIAQTVH